LDDSIPCGVKVSYLLNLLNIVKDGVRNKTLAADQLAAVIDAARGEVTRI